MFTSASYCRVRPAAIIGIVSLTESACLSGAVMGFFRLRRRPTVTASRSSPRSAEVILVWGSSARWRFEPQSGSARYEEHESSQFTLLSQCYKPRTTTQSIRCNRMVRRTSHWPALGWISGLTHSVRYWFRMARHMPYV
jgi:hypothetical protein